MKVSRQEFSIWFQTSKMFTYISVLINVIGRFCDIPLRIIYKIENLGYQWRREDFCSGGGHLATKMLSCAPRRGSGGGAKTLDGSEVLTFKTIQSIRKWIHFSKLTISCQKNPFFSAKTFEKLNRFYKDFIIFSKNYFTNFNF